MSTGLSHRHDHSSPAGGHTLTPWAGNAILWWWQWQALMMDAKSSELRLAKFQNPAMI